MTYGWAILVVLAAIGALAFFGVLDPQNFLPDKCVLQPGIACVGNKIEPTQTTLVISNGLGKTITITQLTVKDCSSSFTTTMQSGNTSTFTLSGCTNGLSKDKFKGEITLKYTESDAGLSKTVYGNIFTKIE